MRKFMALVLCCCMLLGMVDIPAYAAGSDGKNAAAGAGTEEDANNGSTEIEDNKEYLVPIDISNPTGTSISESGSTGTIANFVDNTALVKKNEDGSYHVTLQIENYDKIDIFQVSKPGAIDDSISPMMGSMGTFNVPDTYIFSDKVDGVEKATTYMKGKKIGQQDNAYLDESWNDKFIQNASVENGVAGRTYYSFDVDNLTSSMYVYGFFSYGRKKAKDTEYTSTSARKAGKIWLKVGERQEVKTIDSANYADAGLLFTKANVSGKTGSYADAWLDGKVNQLFEDSTTSVVENGTLTITAQLKNDSNVKSIKELTSIKDLGQSTTTAVDKKFQEYMNLYPKEVDGENGIANYSDELLNDGKVSFTFRNYKEAAFGKRVKIELEDGTAYVAEMRAESHAKQPLTLTDENVTLKTDSYSVDSKATLDAGLVKEDSDEDSEYNLLYSKLAGNASKALMYNLSVKVGDENVTPKYPVELRFKIPDGWDKDKIEVYRLNGTYQEGAWNPLNLYEDNMSIKIEDNEVVVSDTKSVNCTLAVIETSSRVDISEIKDGVYNVNVTMWQQDQPDRLSMSNSAVVSDSARLVVENGKKHIYFDTQGITIGGKYGYSNGIFWANNEQTEEDKLPVLNEYTPLDYYSYYLNDSGSTDMDSYAEQYDLYYPKTVGFEFPESADRDDGVYLNFFVPIMDELQHKVPGSGEGSRTAFMTLSGLESVLEIDEPTHDKSVLVVAADKASKYNADDYTEDSYAVLSAALEKAQAIINGTTSAGDAEIVALDKEISDAISGLKEATGLDKYNKLLKKVQALQETDYTVESWVDLQAVVSAQNGNVTEENADQASADLQAAVDALVSLSEAVRLDEGVYEVQAAFTGLDGSASELSSALKSARLYVAENGSIAAYLYAEGVTGLEYRKGDGYSSAVAQTGRYAFVLPANVEKHKVKVTTESGTADLYLTLDLTGAVKQTINDTALQTAVTEAEALETANYTDESYQVLVAAVLTAKQVLSDKVAFQTELDSAAATLAAAREGLVMREEVQAKLELEQAIADARGNYAEVNYTKDSYEALQAAIEAAEAVLKEETSTAEAMRTQIEALKNAIDGLVRLEDVTDKTELNGYIADAQTKTNEDGSYTENSWNSFQAALASAQKVSEDVNATQESVERQTKLLTAAYEALVPANRQSDLFDEYPQIFAGTYSVPVRLQNATSEEDSMGNASMVQTGTVRVTDKGEVTLELNFQSMKFAGMTGYLYKLKKVDMDTVEYNQFNYPIKYEASDATVLEEYTDTYDDFNNKDSQYYDKNTEGNWYPKKVSIPIKLNDNLFYVEVYVPVMESIGEGQGTKVARMAIDWANIEQKTGAERDNSVMEALLEQVSGMEQGNTPAEYWDALNAAYVSAQDVYKDMNATQEDLEKQITALQAAVDAVDTQNADKTGLDDLLVKAITEANRTDVVYTTATLNALRTAISNAQAVLERENATKAEVQAQITALQKALDDLTVVDKSNLNALIEKAKAEATKTDVYESSSLSVLNTVITMAENVAANASATESDVEAAEKALTSAISNLIKKEVADKSKLESKIAEAKNYLSQTSVYEESSLEVLQSAVNRAQNVLSNSSASQTLVDEQVTKLTEAIQQLVKKSDNKLDRYNLADGVYSITGKMVKVDKSSASMSNEAINHTIKLTVKNGKYSLTMDFCGLNYAGKYGYLGWLKYYKSGYSTDKYGNPTGTLASVTVDSVQRDSKGKIISDTYGSNYPNLVTFPMISEALNDGYVPLQVFVPVMENISAGTGTQPVFLKLSWSTLKKTTADDSAFDDKTTENDSSDDDTTSSLLSFQSTLKASSLGTTSLKSSSLGSSSTSLKSGASSLKSSASGLKGSALDDGAALLSSALDGGAFETETASEVSTGAGAYTTGSSDAAETTSAGGSVPIVPVATSVLVLLAGIFFKLKSRGLLKI